MRCEAPGQRALWTFFVTSRQIPLAPYQAADPAGYPNLLRRLDAGSRRPPQGILAAIFAVSAEVERDDRTVVLVSRRVFTEP